MKSSLGVQFQSSKRTQEVRKQLGFTVWKIKIDSVSRIFIFYFNHDLYNFQIAFHHITREFVSKFYDNSTFDVSLFHIFHTSFLISGPDFESRHGLSSDSLGLGIIGIAREREEVSSIHTRLLACSLVPRERRGPVEFLLRMLERTTTFVDFDEDRSSISAFAGNSSLRCFTWQGGSRKLNAMMDIHLLSSRASVTPAFRGLTRRSGVLRNGQREREGVKYEKLTRSTVPEFETDSGSEKAVGVYSLENKD